MMSEQKQSLQIWDGRGRSKRDREQRKISRHKSALSNPASAPRWSPLLEEVDQAPWGKESSREKEPYAAPTGPQGRKGWHPLLLALPVLPFHHKWL
jgi:hypothetical protein